MNHCVCLDSVLQKNRYFPILSFVSLHVPTKPANNNTILGRSHYYRQATATSFTPSRLSPLDSRLPPCDLHLPSSPQLTTSHSFQRPLGTTYNVDRIRHTSIRLSHTPYRVLPPHSAKLRIKPPSHRRTILSNHAEHTM